MNLATSISCFGCGAPVASSKRYNCCEYCGREHTFAQVEKRVEIRSTQNHTPIKGWVYIILIGVGLFAFGHIIQLIFRKTKKQITQPDSITT